MPDTESLRVAGSGERWRIEGGRRAEDLQLCNDYLGYLADRRYSPASVRAYAFDLLHFARWLDREDLGLDAVDTDALLRYLAERPGLALSRQHQVPLNRMSTISYGDTLPAEPNTTKAGRAQNRRVVLVVLE